jgi:hypothetical protein
MEPALGQKGSTRPPEGEVVSTPATNVEDHVMMRVPIILAFLSPLEFPAPNLAFEQSANFPLPKPPL